MPSLLVPRHRRCGYGLVIVDSWGSMTQQLACYGGLNGRQTVPRAALQTFLCFLQRTTGPDTYVCDATAVSKGFLSPPSGRPPA